MEDRAPEELGEWDLIDEEDSEAPQAGVTPDLGGKTVNQAYRDSAAAGKGALSPVSILRTIARTRSIAKGAR